MSYFSLHCHTEYSNLRFLDSTNKLKDLINTAISLNLKGVAITDHEALSDGLKQFRFKRNYKNKVLIFEYFLEMKFI